MSLEERCHSVSWVTWTQTVQGAFHVLLWLKCPCCNWLKWELSTTNRMKGLVSRLLWSGISLPSTTVAQEQTFLCTRFRFFVLFTFCSFRLALPLHLSPLLHQENFSPVKQIKVPGCFFCFSYNVCAFVCPCMLPVAEPGCHRDLVAES